jgi:hypothetical protein
MDRGKLKEGVPSRGESLPYGEQGIILHFQKGLFILAPTLPVSTKSNSILRRVNDARRKS